MAKENIKAPKHEPSNRMQAARTAANKQRNIVRDMQRKMKKQARKQVQAERKREIAAAKIAVVK